MYTYLTQSNCILSFAKHTQWSHLLPITNCPSSVPVTLGSSLAGLFSWVKHRILLKPEHTNPPSPQSDSFSPGSRYRKYWAKEATRLADAMRNAEICLVSLSLRS
jgi:hypothetical protein